jgi:AraC-like DNA-binding protein
VIIGALDGLQRTAQYRRHRRYQPAGHDLRPRRERPRLSSPCGRQGVLSSFLLIFMTFGRTLPRERLTTAGSIRFSALDIEDLARAACLSPRQFTRVFRSETGTSPARAVEALRLEAAKVMLEQSRLPVEDIASEAGFGNRERMRRAFIRTYGEAPQSIRVNAGPVATI